MRARKRSQRAALSEVQWYADYADLNERSPTGTTDSPIDMSAYGFCCKRFTGSPVPPMPSVYEAAAKLGQAEGEPLAA